MGLQILAPISMGELIDKITILELKCELITDAEKLENVHRELDALELIAVSLPVSQEVLILKEELLKVNGLLWHIENYKRACEVSGDFDAKFIEAARNVYLNNDLRAKIKHKINVLTGSTIVEEKSY
jgi:hypothetical protein